MKIDHLVDPRTYKKVKGKLRLLLLLSERVSFKCWLGKNSFKDLVPLFQALSIPIDSRTSLNPWYFVVEPSREGMLVWTARKRKKTFMEDIPLPEYDLDTDTVISKKV